MGERMKTKRYVVLLDEGVTGRNNQYVIADLYLARIIAWYISDSEKGTCVERAEEQVKYLNQLESL
jgi:hypothetical protein